jgi:ribosomal protein S18 acetylase RimI-like enzyme
MNDLAFLSSHESASPARPSASLYPTIALDELARFLAALQADARHFVAFLAADEATIRLEIPDTFGPSWADRVVLAFGHGALIGCALIDFDVTLRRVWFTGPFAQAEDAAQWAAIADLLWAESRLRLVALLGSATDRDAQSLSQPADDLLRGFRVDLYTDVRNVNLAAFAARHGFQQRDSDAILWLERSARPQPQQAGMSTAPIRPFQGADAAGFTALHDAFFPDTYAPAAAIIAKQGSDADQALLIYAAPEAAGHAGSADPGAVLGYAWVELEAGGDAYLSYIGVAEAARRGGIGRALVMAVAAWAFDEHPGVNRLNLTVRSHNAPAIALYARCGFTYERTAVSYRRELT